jgi:hypothetical protein
VTCDAVKLRHADTAPWIESPVLHAKVA